MKEVSMAARKPIRERFDEKWQFIAPTGCWEWTGTMHSCSYGLLFVSGSNVGAHRVSWELHNGPIQEGLHVLHKCDNRKCCNPEHLFLGTNSDNIKDRTDKGRQAKGAALPQTRLSCESVSAIREMYKRHPTGRGSGKSSGVMKFLAEWFRVSEATISEAARGKKWRHI
jgi:hypothetical protein